MPLRQRSGKPLSQSASSPSSFDLSRPNILSTQKPPSVTQHQGFGRRESVWTGHHRWPRCQFNPLARAISAWSAHTRATATRPVHAWPVAAGPAGAGTTAARSVHTRAVTAGPVDAGTTDARPTDARPADAGTMNRPAPTVPAYRATLAEAATQPIAAPIPAGPTPASVVPAIAPSPPNELNGLYGSKCIRRRADRAGVHHGRIGPCAYHCTHDRKRSGQSQANFSHCILLARDGLPSTKTSTRYRRSSCITRG